MPKIKSVSKNPVSTIRKKAPHKHQIRKKAPCKHHHVKKKDLISGGPELLIIAEEIQEKSLNKQFLVSSFIKSNTKYDVRCNSTGVWTCDCPNFVYKSSVLQATYGWACKHIKLCIECIKKDKIHEIK